MRNGCYNFSSPIVLFQMSDDIKVPGFNVRNLSVPSPHLRVSSSPTRLPSSFLAWKTSLKSIATQKGKHRLKRSGFLPQSSQLCHWFVFRPTASSNSRFQMMKRRLWHGRLIWRSPELFSKARVSRKPTSLSFSQTILWWTSRTARWLSHLLVSRSFNLYPAQRPKGIYDRQAEDERKHDARHKTWHRSQGTLDPYLPSPSF